MSGTTETASVTETRQLEAQAQLTEGHAQVNASATTLQATTNDAVDTTSTTLPSQYGTRDDREELGQKDGVKSPGVSALGSLSEIPMNTRINDGSTTEAPTDMQHERHHEVEGDTGRSGPTAPPHFTPWLPNSTPRAYASPFVMLATESNAGPLPAGFQPYDAVLPEPQRSSVSPFIPPYWNANPPAQGYIPVAPASQPLMPTPSYAQSPFVPVPVPQGPGGYGQSLVSPYYPARVPIRRRREVYVSQDPFHKWNQRKPIPARVTYNPYAPADNVGVNSSTFTPLPTPYRPSPLPPTRTAEYPARPTWYPPYGPMPYPPGWSQPPVAPLPDQTQRIYNPQQSKAKRYIPGIMPSELSAIMQMSPSGRVSVPLDKLNELLGVSPGHPDELKTSPPPSPRSARSVERRGYSVSSDKSSPTSLSRFPSVVPDLAADDMIALPPPHEFATRPASSSTIAFASANAAASPMHSAPSPSTGDHASLNSKRSDTPDPPPSPFINGPASPQFLSDVEKQDSHPYHPAPRGIGRMIPESLRSWGRRVSRWALPPQRHHHTSRPVLYSQDGEYASTSGSDKNSSIKAKAIEYTTQRAPTYMYLVVLLFLPSFYQSRVARLFDEAELAMPEMEQMAIRTSLQAQNLLDEQVPEGQEVFPLQWTRLKSTWEHFIDSLLKEWKTLNVISALLLSAILTILQIDDAANDYLIRYTALLSLVCSLVSLLFGCIYIIRFGTMRKTYKAAEWAAEVQESRTSTWWNVFILLALPSIWLTWSILLYVICIMSYIWRTAANVQKPPPPLSDQTVLKIRIGFTILLGVALLYACFVLATFKRYGRAMDIKWAARIENWRLGGVYPSGGPPAGAIPVSPYPYGSYPAGTVLNSVPRDINRDRRSVDENWRLGGMYSSGGLPAGATPVSPYPYGSYPTGTVLNSVPRDINRDRRPVDESRVRFRDNESYIPRASVPSDSPANSPYWLGEHYRNTPTDTREHGTGSYDIYQSDLSSRHPDLEAAPVSSTQADILPPLGPAHLYPERLSQTAYPLHPSELPLQRSPDGFRPPSHDKMPSVTRTSSVSPQRNASPPPRLADTQAPQGRAASIVEDQQGSPTEPSSHDIITAQLFLSEAPGGQAALATYTSSQDTRTISSTHSLPLPGHTQNI